MRHFMVAVAITSAMLLGGCNKKTESATSSAGTKAAPKAQESHSSAKPSKNSTKKSTDHTAAKAKAAEQALAESASPDQVVLAFLEATRNGDDQLAAKLLSKKALEATTRAGLIVSPPGTPSMQYEIGEVEYPEHHADGAYVKSVWHERFDDGEERFDVTWVLRKQPEGWRIVGMAMEFPGSDEPDLINFEAPDQLRQKMLEASADPESAADEGAANDFGETDERAQSTADDEGRTVERLPSKRPNLR